MGLEVLSAPEGRACEASGIDAYPYAASRHMPCSEAVLRPWSPRSWSDLIDLETCAGSLLL